MAGALGAAQAAKLLQKSKKSRFFARVDAEVCSRIV